MPKEAQSPKYEMRSQSFWASGFVIRISFVIRHSSFVIRHLRRYALRFRFLRLGLPLADFVLMDPAQREQLFFVIYQLFASCARERIIFHQENGFFGTNLLAITAENAAQH